ncbi:MAG: glycosyltransferase family 2 protein, partial [Candidatus Cloacimonetes bacterium]|nr:glycosyltransferase family 2 protein [Candidatus Cloacimonadota bacterium]
MSITNPNVSVIVPAFNADKTLPTCLKSILKQNYPTKKVEIIVINDGSTDKTITFLRSLTLSERFKVIHHSENCGLAAARNTGIKNAKGDILIFLDSDMEVEEDFIEKHVSSHGKSGVIGVLGSILPDIENPYDKYQRYLYESKRGAAKFDINKPIPFNTFIFNNTSINRTIFKKTGLFDENIKMY